MTTPTPSSVWVVCDKEGDCLFASEHKSIADDHFQHCVDEESDFRAGPYTLTEYVPKRDLAAAQSVERERCAKIVEQYSVEIEGMPRTSRSLKPLADIIRSGE